MTIVKAYGCVQSLIGARSQAAYTCIRLGQPGTMIFVMMTDSTRALPMSLGINLGTAQFSCPDVILLG